MGETDTTEPTVMLSKNHTAFVGALPSRVLKNNSGMRKTWSAGGRGWLPHSPGDRSGAISLRRSAVRASCSDTLAYSITDGLISR